MPIHTLLSGPAAGVTAAAALGTMLGEPNLLTMDMGGTSTDISLIRGHRAMASHDGRVGDFPLMMPVTAIEAIGAGGGSIAWLDGPVLKVGPRSAGAAPGPACYGRGGTQPTVSDAYLLCGYLSEDAPLAGGLRLRRDLAEQAMRPIAAALGADAIGAAESVVAVATANMLANALPFIARLGVAPAELTLMIFGGAGAIHGPLLADEIGIGRVVVPRVSSVFCAFGCLVSDLLYDVVRTVHGAALDAGGGRRALCGDAPTRARPGSGSRPPRFRPHSSTRRMCAMPASPSTSTAPVAAEAARAGDLDAIAASFHDEHARLYGHAHPRQSDRADRAPPARARRARAPGSATRRTVRRCPARAAPSPRPLQRRVARYAAARLDRPCRAAGARRDRSSSSRRPRRSSSRPPSRRRSATTATSSSNGGAEWIPSAPR